MASILLLLFVSLLFSSQNILTLEQFHILTLWREKSNLTIRFGERLSRPLQYCLSVSLSSLSDDSGSVSSSTFQGFKSIQNTEKVR